MRGWMNSSKKETKDMELTLDIDNEEFQETLASAVEKSHAQMMESLSEELDDVASDTIDPEAEMRLRSISEQLKDGTEEIREIYGE